MSRRRQVSWLTVTNAPPHLPEANAPVAIGIELTAYSCGGSYGFGFPLTAFPLGPSREPTTARMIGGNEAGANTIWLIDPMIDDQALIDSCAIVNGWSASRSILMPSPGSFGTAIMPSASTFGRPQKSSSGFGPTSNSW